MNSIAVEEGNGSFRVDVNTLDGNLDQNRSGTMTNLRAFVQYVNSLLGSGDYYMNPSTERKWEELKQRAG